MGEGFTSSAGVLTVPGLCHISPGRLALADRSTPGQTRLMRRRRGGSPIRLLVIAVGMGLVLTACGGETPYVPAGIVRTPAPDVSDLVLPDVTNGVDLAFQAEPGGILIVYWGYTACPDICPTTLVEVRKALRDLGDLADSVGVAMVTVTPPMSFVTRAPLIPSNVLASDTKPSASAPGTARWPRHSAGSRT